MFKRILAALIAALFLSVLFLWYGPYPSWAAETGSYFPTGENRVAYLINREHTRVCGSGLFRSYQHNNLDRWRSRDMVSRDYFSHTIEGTSSKAWSYFGRYGIGEWKGAGENIGWNNYPDSYSADAVYQAFMNSAGHRALIQACAYNSFGVGAYEGPTGKKMYTVTFSVQPVERVSWYRAPVRKSPTSASGRLFYAYRGARQVIFRHAYDSRGRRWDYGHFAKGWGWVRDSKTR